MRRAIRSPLLLMGVTVFIDITGFGLVLPLLPFWAQRLGADAFVIGLITTAYALAQFLFTPLLGALSDRYGRRPVILISLLVEAAAFAMTALAGTLPLLLAAPIAIISLVAVLFLTEVPLSRKSGIEQRLEQDADPEVTAPVA